MENADHLPIPATFDDKAKPHVGPMNFGESQHEKNSHATSITITQEFGGPLPPPSILRGYNDVVPGLADTLVKAFQDEMEHRRNLESRSVEAEITDQQSSRQERRRGQQFGCMICIIAIVAGAVTAVLAPSVAGQLMGGLIGAGGLTSLVYVFITGRPGSKDEPREKPKTQPNNKSSRKKPKK